MRLRLLSQYHACSSGFSSCSSTSRHTRTNSDAGKKIHAGLLSQYHACSSYLSSCKRSHTGSTDDEGTQAHAGCHLIIITLAVTLSGLQQRLQQLQQQEQAHENKQ
jgi:hypothetical protein